MSKTLLASGPPPINKKKGFKMNKNILYFGLGALLGGAAGSVATYFIVKEKIEAEASDEIEAYAEHCEQRIEKIKKKMVNKVFGAPKEEKEEKPSTDDEKIENNKGVKKYHHYDGMVSKYGENHIFDKPQSDEEREEIKKQIKDSKLINDIDEDEFMNDENGYEKQTIDVFLGDDKYMCGVWGYQTDNEDDVDRKWGKELPELIGAAHTYDELLSYCDDDTGVGVVLVRNDEMKIDFDVVIHDNREDDK